jgi:adenine-specific DNA-methyltransferase
MSARKTIQAETVREGKTRRGGTVRNDAGEPSALLSDVDEARLTLSPSLAPDDRAARGQYFTPSITARFMAKMMRMDGRRVRLLDPGAGVGALTAAWVVEMLGRKQRPEEVLLTVFEKDERFIPQLRQTLGRCRESCEEADIRCSFEVGRGDFIEAGVNALDRGLFASEPLEFDAAILNPPYKKFRADSRARTMLRRLGIETGNLYAAFLALVVLMLREGGELVSITPRSFCNGPYFRPFREHLLGLVSLERFHLFETRDRAFRDDKVLQENVILHAVKRAEQAPTVHVSQSRTPEDPDIVGLDVPFARVVRPADPERFIHLVTDENGHSVAVGMEALPCTLSELGLTVSTGRVVDFRARELMRADPGPGTVPLIYPVHFDDGRISWPKPGGKKPNAIAAEASREALLVQAGPYVLVKRFSAKEEKRRVVAAVFDPADVPCGEVGFENHLNYFHEAGSPLDIELACGLAAFLNSSRVDLYFRQFNGHTQVNATDLRTLRYPPRRVLLALGKRVERIASHEEVDRALEDLLPRGADKP